MRKQALLIGVDPPTKKRSPPRKVTHGTRGTFLAVVFLVLELARLGVYIYQYYCRALNTYLLILKYQVHYINADLTPAFSPSFRWTACLSAGSSLHKQRSKHKTEY